MIGVLCLLMQIAASFTKCLEGNYSGSIVMDQFVQAFNTQDEGKIKSMSLENAYFAHKHSEAQTRDEISIFFHQLFKNPTTTFQIGSVRDLNERTCDSNRFYGTLTAIVNMNKTVEGEVYMTSEDNKIRRVLFMNPALDDMGFIVTPKDNLVAMNEFVTAFNNRDTGHIAKLIAPVGGMIESELFYPARHLFNDRYWDVLFYEGINATYRMGEPDCMKLEETAIYCHGPVNITTESRIVYDTFNAIFMKGKAVHVMLPRLRPIALDSVSLDDLKRMTEKNVTNKFAAHQFITHFNQGNRLGVSKLFMYGFSTVSIMDGAGTVQTRKRFSKGYGEPNKDQINMLFDRLFSNTAAKFEVVQNQSVHLGHNISYVSGELNAKTARGVINGTFVVLFINGRIRSALFSNSALKFVNNMLATSEFVKQFNNKNTSGIAALLADNCRIEEWFHVTRDRPKILSIFDRFFDCDPLTFTAVPGEPFPDTYGLSALADYRSGILLSEYKLDHTIDMATFSLEFINGQLVVANLQRDLPSPSSCGKTIP